jgi:light-regulated signal transduction histidine kinase (bacteriophytochrome)
VTEQLLYQKQLQENELELQKNVLQRTIELENANKELKRSNANLEEFAYAASHDLKEPIRKIHFFADRLQSHLTEKLDEQAIRYFEKLQTGANRMSTLIDDLLMYSHINRGASHLESVDLGHVLSLVEEDLELAIKDKEGEIHIGQLPTITGHKRQLQQLFENLVGNSLKYSQPGVPPNILINSSIIKGKEISIPLSIEDGEKNYHLIEVRDNGIGFQQEDAERIFNVFTRLHGNAEYKGTGVGLSIARKVVENHKGFISAESTPGAGATFRIFLPVE